MVAAEALERRCTAEVLPPSAFLGKKKIPINKDIKAPKAYFDTINKENHTLGNIIQSQLHRRPHRCCLPSTESLTLAAQDHLLFRCWTAPQEAPTCAIKNLTRSSPGEAEQVAIKVQQGGNEW